MSSRSSWPARILLLAAVLGAAPRPGQAQVTVRVQPSAATVNVGDTFDLQVRADVDIPVVGWGLDVTFNDLVLSKAAAPTIGPAWSAAYAADGDGLAGLAFPAAISGRDILLATLHLRATAVGQTHLLLGATAGDLAEGFPLETSGSADVQYMPAIVTVVPEPATGLLLLAYASWLAQPRRRLQWP